MKHVRTMKMLLSGKPTSQSKPKKTHRSLTAVIADTVVGWLLDLLKAKWNNELWKPKD
jgi:hypothetical protein